jgi:hypothetical protein
VGRSREPARLINRPLPALLTLLLSPVAPAAAWSALLSRHAQSASDEYADRFSSESDDHELSAEEYFPRPPLPFPVRADRSPLPARFPPTQGRSLRA